MGFKAVQSLQAIHVINGKITLSAQAMLALVKKGCPTVEVVITGDSTKSTCVMVDGKSSYTSEWDIAKATSMGLWGRGSWAKQPATMLRWRAVSEACRIMFPHILLGLYTDDEAGDFPEQEKEIDLSGCIDKDFPIPENEKIPGPDYRIQNGGLSGKQFKNIPIDDLSAYYDKLEERKTPQHWNADLMVAIAEYIEEQERMD